MANFDDISEACRLLGLGETATLKEIKQAYRRMAFRHHPDTSNSENKAQGEEAMKKLNSLYKYSFTEEDVARAYPYDEYFRKYHRGWFEGI